jgi:xanthine/CO dehydrogenase XdhC/CoxF family maturation factor
MKRCTNFLCKLHNPSGIDLGGQAPEEIALAIMAEIVAVHNGRSPDILTK